MSSKSVIEECQARVSHKSVKSECQARVPYQSVAQKCQARVSYKSVTSVCQVRVFHKWVRWKLWQISIWSLFLNIRVSIRVSGFHLVFFFWSASATPYIISYDIIWYIIDIYIHITVLLFILQEDHLCNNLLQLFRSPSLATYQPPQTSTPEAGWRVDWRSGRQKRTEKKTMKLAEGLSPTLHWCLPFSNFIQFPAWGKKTEKISVLQCFVQTLCLCPLVALSNLDNLVVGLFGFLISDCVNSKRRPS